MILTCPSCGTQYAVKDGAIPPEGRKVRCAACGHSWHQPSEGPQPSPVSEGDPPPPPEAPDSWEPEEPQREETSIAVGQSPVEPIPPGAPLVEPPTSVPVPPPDAEQWSIEPVDESPEEIAKEIPDATEIAAAEDETPTERRRSWWIGVLIGLLVVAIIVLALWLFAPDSVRRGLGLASVAPPALQIAAGTPERQKLASGNELVVVSGRIINPSSSEQPVPPIKAQLRDRTGRLVYSWMIEPPAPKLAPGGSASFNSAEVDVPSSGPDSTVRLSLNS